MTTSIQSIDASTSAILVGGVESLRLTTTGPQLAGVNGGQIAGFRNKIRNGKMELSQRGASFATAIAGAYHLDGWFYSFGNTSVSSIAQIVDTPASAPEFQYSQRITVTTADAAVAASDWCYISQLIEGYVARDLLNTTFTISFWVRSSKTGTHCLFLQSGATDGSYVSPYTVNAANTWEKKSITITGGINSAIGTGWNFGSGIGLRVCWALMVGTTFQTATTNAWAAGNLLGTAAQVNCMDTVGNIFAITGVQVEKGSLATPFEHVDFAVEMVRNQRYYQRFAQPMLRGLVVGVAGSTTTSIGRMGMMLPVMMRAAPTASLTAPLPIYDGINTTTVSILAPYCTTQGVEFDMTAAANVLGTGRPALCYQDNSGSALILNAEL